MATIGTPAILTTFRLKVRFGILHQSDVYRCINMALRLYQHDFCFLDSVGLFLNYTLLDLDHDFLRACRMEHDLSK